MFKKMLFLFLTAAIALSACGTLEVSIDQTPTPSATEAQLSDATSTPEPIQSAASASETPTAAGPLPSFSNIAFYRTSFKPAECGNDYQQIFPARILQVHARWDYANMRAGLTIQREWYSNGKLWAKYNEAWDFAKYGAQGSVNDIPIYDLDAGLEPGAYELRLYIDGQPQFNEASKPGFVVDKDWSLEITSPNKRMNAVISLPQKLTIRETNGTKWELAKAHEIPSLAWFPDSQHIVYSDTDRSKVQDCSTIGIRYTLWLVDAATSAQHQIGRDDQNLHSPVVSPDGKYIAAISGSGTSDACGVDSSLLFVELDNKFQQFHSFHMEDFAGVPMAADGLIIYPVSTPGFWKDDTRFVMGLSWICSPRDDPSGLYMFDLSTKEATRVGNLPKP